MYSVTTYGFYHQGYIPTGFKTLWGRGCISGSMHYTQCFISGFIVWVAQAVMCWSIRLHVGLIKVIGPIWS